MFRKTNNTILVFIFFIISVSLIATFVIQYGLDHQPCKLCIYERIPYFLSIFFILEIIFFKKKVKITLLFLTLIFAISTILALYHLGIEQEFFAESFICEDKNFFGNLSKEQILEQLKQNNISCKDVSFKILGFSLASINSIISLVLSVIFLRLFTNYGKN